jgi:plasmid stabilization system protein ParE
MKLEFHPEAELELIEAAAYYELRVPGLGERFEAEVRRATDLLLQHPEIGPAADPVLRKLVLNRFPFTLYYKRYIRRSPHRSRRTPKPTPRLLAVES